MPSTIVPVFQRRSIDRRGAAARLWLTAVATLASLVAAAPASAATAHSETASLGSVSATLTYDTVTSGAFPYANLQLSITRSGTPIYSAPVVTKACGTECEPDHPDTPSLHVVDLNGDGQTEVVLDLFTGGAHCCSVDAIYSIDPTSGAVTQAEHSWGDPGATLADLSHDGRLEFVTADDRFAYAFDAFAFSGLPIEVERFAGGTFTDVTNAYPALVALDATRWYRLYRENIRTHTGLGALAAWAADEDRLGHAALVARTLSSENRLGHLRADGAPWKGGRAFINELGRFLAKTGYR